LKKDQKDRACLEFQASANLGEQDGEKAYQQYCR